MASCDSLTSKIENLPEPLKEVKIALADRSEDLGNVSIMLPARYDTAFQWIHYSDCSSCDKFKYRFQPKNTRIYKENGFFWKTLLDSVDQLTIVHESYHNTLSRSDSSIIVENHYAQKNNIKKQSKNRPYLDIPIADTIEKINSKYFSIFSYRNQDLSSNIINQQLIANTVIGGAYISFEFELRTSQKDSLSERFLSNCRYYLRTIHMSERK